MVADLIACRTSSLVIDMVGVCKPASHVPMRVFPAFLIRRFAREGWVHFPTYESQCNAETAPPPGNPVSFVMFSVSWTCPFLGLIPGPWCQSSRSSRAQSAQTRAGLRRAVVTIHHDVSLLSCNTSKTNNWKVALV